jgi:hypothetical protein
MRLVAWFRTVLYVIALPRELSCIPNKHTSLLNGFVQEDDLAFDATLSQRGNCSAISGLIFCCWRRRRSAIMSCRNHAGFIACALDATDSSRRWIQIFVSCETQRGRDTFERALMF